MAYGEPAELARRLGITNPAPTPAQEDALQLALDTAAEEIDWELTGVPGWDPPPTVPPYPALVVTVSYDRAKEHWHSGLSVYGAVTVGGVDGVPVFASKDSWWRHHLKLIPLKATPSGIA